MVLFVIIAILMSCYVGVSDIKDETKTSYFISLVVIAILVVIANIF